MPAAEPAVRNIPSLRAPYAPADEAIAAGLLASAARPPAAEARIDARATRLVEAIRARIGRPRRRRGFPARLCALDQGGPGADGAGRGAAARARRRHRRPPDRGQAQGRRLGASRGALGRASGVGLGLDARHHRARHPSGRDAGEHRRGAGQAARPAGGARRDAPGDAAARLAFRARRRPSRRRSRAPARSASFAIPSTCWARARAPPPMPRAISRPTPHAIERDRQAAPATTRCRAGRAFR